MRNINKTLLIVGIICVIVIIFCLGKYFHKYYVITKFQQKLNEIEESGNYKFKFGDVTYYVKDNIYVSENSSQMYQVADKNKDDKKAIIIGKDTHMEIEAPVFATPKAQFSILSSNDKPTIWNIIKSIETSSLTTKNIGNQECYKLFFRSEYNLNQTIYFNKKTYMPVAYEYDGQINYVEVTVGTVTDEDVSVDKIYEKVMELPN